MRGQVANSSGGQVNDPAVYGVLVERGGVAAAADLPFEVGGRAGHLLPAHVEWSGVAPSFRSKRTQSCCFASQAQ